MHVCVYVLVYHVCYQAEAEGRAPLDLCQVYYGVVVNKADQVILLVTSLKLWVHRRRTSLRSKSIVLDSGRSSVYTFASVCGTHFRTGLVSRAAKRVEISESVRTHSVVYFLLCFLSSFHL